MHVFISWYKASQLNMTTSISFLLFGICPVLSCAGCVVTQEEGGEGPPCGEEEEPRVVKLRVFSSDIFVYIKTHSSTLRNKKEARRRERGSE